MIISKVPDDIQWYTFLDIGSVSNMMKTSSHGYELIKNKAGTMMNYFKECVSGCPIVLRMNNIFVSSTCHIDVDLQYHILNIELMSDKDCFISRFDIANAIEWEINTPYFQVRDTIYVDRNIFRDAIQDGSFQCDIHDTKNNDVHLTLSFHDHDDHYFTNWRIQGHITIGTYFDEKSVAYPWLQAIQNIVQFALNMFHTIYFCVRWFCFGLP